MAAAKQRWRAMGSDVVVMVDGPPELIRMAELRLAELESRWSRFRPDSEISVLNRSAAWVAVSADTMTLVTRGFEAWALTRGVFDPTILPVLVANGYAASKSDIPGETILPDSPPQDYSHGPAAIEFDKVGGRIKFPTGLAFDPGGVGKGLAADIVVEELLGQGAMAAMVSIGGDLRIAAGPDSPWSVVVEDPYDASRSIAELNISDGGVATSSVLAKEWRHDGKRWHHLIDPGTGRPMKTANVSATVVAAEAWLADVLCKTALKAKPLHGLAMLDAQGLDGIIVDRNGVVWPSAGLARFAA